MKSLINQYSQIGNFIVIDKSISYGMMCIEVKHMKLHYGILSTATITSRFICAVQEYGDSVHAIASRSLEKAEKMAQQYHIPKAYGSYDELYQDDDVDIIYIATINASHATEIEKALSHGKHVICEKPIALSGNEAKKLFAFAKKQKRFLMEAQKSLFLPITQKIKTMIENKELGSLHQIEMSASFPNPKASWMHDPLQGGVIYGSASYTIEYLTYLLKPEYIKLQALGTKEMNGTCNQVSINIRMDEVLINSRIAMNVATQKHALFYFDNGYINVPEYWKARCCFIHKGNHVEKVNFPVTYEMIYEVEHVHACISNNVYISPIMSDKISIACCEYVEQMFI